MKVVTGNFLYPSESHAPKLLLAPGNGVVNIRGELVMGAGAAKALAEAYPWLPEKLGAMAKRSPKRGDWHLYGVLAVEVEEKLSLGVFQTKGNWREKADLAIIAHSAQALARWLDERPGWEAHLAFPGIGLGGLDAGSVAEVLEPLLRNLPVTLYRFEPQTTPSFSSPHLRERGEVEF